MRRLAAGLALAVLAGGCAAEETVRDVRRAVEDATVTADPAYTTYVALGDSFTAAPLVPTTHLADGCFRSDSNYPSLVAERLDIARLVDVSCSGAATADLTRRQATVRQATVPPQLRALPREADLVTLGIGGNDFGLFHTLVATCSRVGRTEPSGSPCADTLAGRGVDLVARARAVGPRVVRALERIRHHAPRATVVLVGYLRLLPEAGRCRALPFARGDYALGRRVSAALDATLDRAARRAGVRYLDMHRASAGHDACSGDPWVNGHRTREDEALAYHPFAEGQEAVADALVAALRR